MIVVGLWVIVVIYFECCQIPAAVPCHPLSLLYLNRYRLNGQCS